MDEGRNAAEGPAGSPPPSGSGPGSARGDAALRAAILAGFLAVVWLASGSPERATLFGVEGPACPSRLLLPERGCPGCGLTRASAMALDGDWRASLALHPGGLVLITFALGALLLHSLTLVRGEKSAWTVRLLRSGRVVLAGAILAAWIAR